MKKQIVYLFLLLPIFSFSQCPKWIGNSVDSALSLESVAEKFLQVPLTKTSEKIDKSNIDFANKSCSCEFLYSLSKQKTPDTKGKKKHLTVNKILIVGPEDKVHKMYTEFFYPRVKPCATAIQPTTLTYNKTFIDYYLLTMHGEKLAEIILHK